jgi:hypothetical protein
MARTGRTAIVVFLTALVTGPLAADWLVLTDGTRMETRGEWEEKGRLVVFTTTDGTLASLRLDSVDLEASRRATELAARPPAPPEPPPAEPAQAVYVLTDADVTHELSPDVEDADADASTTAGPQAARLVVTDWQDAPLADESGTRITGTLRNVSDDATTRVRLTVLVYDATGDLLATDNATLSSQALMPDQQARYQVEFSGIYTIAAVTFRPSTLPLDVGPPPGNGQAPAEPAAEEPFS